MALKVHKMKRYLLILCLAFGSLARGSDGTWTVVGTNIWAAAQPTSTGKTLGALQGWNGKLYSGYGDYDVNSGPIRLMALDPATGAFANEYTFETEAIYVFRPLFGRLYVPPIDPRYASGIAVGKVGTGWEFQSVSMAHGFDMTTLTGGDLWLVGSVGNAEAYGSTAMRSLDDGATWEMSLNERTSNDDWSRYYFVSTLNGKLYVQSSETNHCSVFDGTGWTNGPAIAPYGSLAQEFAGQMVLLSSHITPNSLGDFLSFDGTNAPATLLNSIYNYTLSGGVLYALGGDRVIRSTSNLVQWANVCSNAPPGSRSIAVLNGKLYAGTTNSDIHVYSTPVSTLQAVTVLPAKDFASEERPGDEPDAGTFTIKRVGMTSAELTVNFTLSGTATMGVDYAAVLTSVTIPPGADSVPVSIVPLQDDVTEGAEFVMLALSPSPAYCIETPADARIIIGPDPVKPVFVDIAATGANTGADWANAYTNLRTAVDSTGGGTQLWVAVGTYLPGTARGESFILRKDMCLYGGFTNGMISLKQRDWNAHPTILSGEIQQDGNVSNNSYHIVVGATNAVLDGFTVAYAYADGSTPNDRGGGVIVGGGPAYAPVIAGTQTIDHCMFLFNFATNGAAIYGSNSNVTVANSLFVSNRAVNGGAIYGEQFASGSSRQVVVTNCVFRQNSATSKGGAMNCNTFQHLWVDACRFIGNSASSDGGAVFTQSSWQADPGVTDCLFIGNSSGGNGGAMANEDSGANVCGCTFIGNDAYGGGGGVSSYNGSLIVRDSLLAGNTASGNGGGVYAAWKAVVFGNCLLVGNCATGTTSEGGGFYQDAGGFPSALRNCTISGNKAGKYGGAIATYSGQNITQVNCIAWGDVASVAGNEFYGNTNTCYYSDVSGGWVNGDNNMDRDPRFAGGPSGAWTAVGNYDPIAGLTVLTDAVANWIPGTLAGHCLNADTSQCLQLLVADNTATTVTAWGAAAFTAAGKCYQVWDYHLKSKGGRWTSSGWVKDSVHSPCIDAGDPAATYSLEPEKNGGRVNMGAYGNTDQASMTAPPPSETVMIVR